MNRTLFSLVLGIALVGCETEVPDEPIGGWVSGTEVVGVDVSPATGVAPFSGMARAVNEFGAAVPSPGARSVSVDGTDQSVSFDAWGYGAVTLSEAHTAQVMSGEQSVWMTAVEGDFQGFGLMPAMASGGDPLFMQPVTGAMVVSTLHEVFWVPFGGTPHRILNFPVREIRGMSSAHLDGDGVLDLVVWGGDTVAFLRGRPGGGMAWGGAVVQDGGEDGLALNAGGVIARDITSDDRIDIAIAWGHPEGEHVLQVWEGDGLFGFTDWLLVDIIENPTGMAVGDNTGDGSQQITVMLEPSGTWQRFAIAGGDVLGVGPVLESLGLGPMVEAYAGLDYNGDGGEELVVVGPRVAGSNRKITMYDLKYDGNVIPTLPIEYPDAHFAFVDGNTDGLGDIFALEKAADTGDVQLKQLGFDGESYRQWRPVDMFDHGPIAFGETTGDDVVDLLLAGALWKWYPGELMTNDYGEFWGVGEPGWGVWNQGVSGPIAQADSDSDPSTVELVGIVDGNGSMLLKTWRVNAPTVEGEPPTLQEVRASQLANTSSTGLDVAVCGAVAYALTSDHLSLVNLVNGNRTARIPTTGTKVDCGDGPSGAEAAVLDGNTIRLYDAALNEVGTQPADGAMDIAIGQTDGAASVMGCAEAGCSIVGWDIGQSWIYATGTDAGVMLHSADGDRDLGPVGGALALWDVNGDGTVDLIAASTNAEVGVYLSSGDGVGVGEFFHTRAALGGQAIVGDVTGDGQADIMLSDDEGSLYQSLGLPPAPDDSGGGTDSR